MDWKAFCGDVNASFPKIFYYILENCGTSPGVAKFALQDIHTVNTEQAGIAHEADSHISTCLHLPVESQWSAQFFFWIYCLFIGTQLDLLSSFTLMQLQTQSTTHHCIYKEKQVKYFSENKVLLEVKDSSTVTL